MKILVLGAGGMLGHLASILFKEKYGSRAVLAARKPTGFPLIDDGLEVLDVSDLAGLQGLIMRIRPCTVVNCVAVNDPKQGPDLMQEINARLPQRLVTALDAVKDGSRLVHISTDGVFRGDKGGYDEDALPDADDIYGRTKQEGEAVRPPHLTIRTSIVGPDPIGSHGLMHWFLSQESAVRGFSRVFWSGVTTLELARFIDFAIEDKTSGLYHLASTKISKYDLLCLMKDVFARDVAVAKEEGAFLDRSLTTRRKEVAFRVSEHRRMMLELKEWMSDHHRIYTQYLSHRE